MTLFLDNKKYLYSAGDSFTYGDELLEHVAALPEALSRWNGNGFELTKMYSIYIDSKDEYYQLLAFKNTLTYCGRTAAALGLEHRNFAQPGASIDNILFQCYMIINDIKASNINPAEVTVIVGLTTHLRKAYYNVRELNNGCDLLHNTAGSLMLGHPSYSIHGMTTFSSMLGHHVSTDQLLLEYCFQVANIVNLLSTVGVTFRIVNVWTDDIFKDFTNSTFKHYSELALETIMPHYFPDYPESLSSTRGLGRLPKGHPNEATHALWATRLTAELSKVAGK